MRLEDLSAEGTYRVAGYSGVAWSFHGPEVEYGTEWVPFEGATDEELEVYGDGYEEEYERATGMAYMVMVGDDRTFVIDPEDVSELAEGEWCPSCGQIGCGAYGTGEE